MSEKDQKDEPGKPATKQSSAAQDATAGKAPKKSKEDRLAEALRANLRRRKSAAKSRKQG